MRSSAAAKSIRFGIGRIAYGSKHSGKLVQAWPAWCGEGIKPLFCGIQGKPINRPLGITKVQLIITEAVAAGGLPP